MSDKKFPPAITDCPLKDAIITNGSIKNDKIKLGVDFYKCLNCTNCKIVCPVGLVPYKDKKLGILQSEECIKCGTCVANCPSKALSFKVIK